MQTQQYRELVRAALPRAIDADTAGPNLRTLFTPDGHRLALDPDVTIVRGARGVGKTVWFKVLQDPDLRAVAAQAYALPRLASLTTYPGFGSELAPDRYPGPAVLRSLLELGHDPVRIWEAVLVGALAPERLGGASRWSERVGRLRDDSELLDDILAAADRDAGRLGETRLVIFDALDRLATDRSTADKLVSGVLQLALELRTRTRNLRAKVLIRQDMFSSSTLHFPDSSKLLSNAADLTWTEASLYGLLFHHLGNSEDSLAGAFRAAWPGWTQDPRGARRFQAPVGLAGDTQLQQEAFVDIAGPYMGTNHRKGHTYTWLPNHLMDGMGQVSPRSFLRALAQAVELTFTQYAGHAYAIHYDGIRRGVQEASRLRVAEIAEDLPWVRSAVGDLAGMQVPVEPEPIIERWSERDLSQRLAADSRAMDDEDDEDASGVRTGPRDPLNYWNVIDELVELGIMTRRSNGRIDLPDVYRIAFNVGRKGGVPRLKAP